MNHFNSAQHHSGINKICSTCPYTDTCVVASRETEYLLNVCSIFIDRHRLINATAETWEVQTCCNTDVLEGYISRHSN